MNYQTKLIQFACLLIGPKQGALNQQLREFPAQLSLPSNDPMVMSFSTMVVTEAVASLVLCNQDMTEAEVDSAIAFFSSSAGRKIITAEKDIALGQAIEKAIENYQQRVLQYAAQRAMPQMVVLAPGPKPELLPTIPSGPTGVAVARVS